MLPAREVVDKACHFFRSVRFCSVHARIKLNTYAKHGEPNLSLREIQVAMMERRLRESETRKRRRPNLKAEFRNIRDNLRRQAGHALEIMSEKLGLTEQSAAPKTGGVVVFGRQLCQRVGAESPRDAESSRKAVA